MTQNGIETFFLIFKVSSRSWWVQKSFWLGILTFACCLLILFPFSLGVEVIKRADVQIGCLWAIMEFVAALCIGRMFAPEQEAQALDILLCSRSSRSAILFGKLCFTAVLIFSLQIPIVFFWLFFFNVQSNSILFLLEMLFTISFFFCLGCASLGSLIHALTSRSHAKEILQPILFFPFQSAILLAAVSLSLSANSSSSLTGALSNQAWWSILILYPLIFISLGCIFSGFLLEE